MNRTISPDTTETRSWSVEELVDGLQDLYSPLRTYGGICYKFIEDVDLRLKSHPDDQNLLADKAFYEVALASIEKGLNICHDLVDWMQTLPVDESGNVHLDS